MIKVTPDRVCDICDDFLSALAGMEPEIDAFCRPIEERDSALNEERMREWRAEVDGWEAADREILDARRRWSNAPPFFRGPEPVRVYCIPPSQPWLIFNSPRGSIQAIKRKVEEMRARGRLACEPFDITAEEAVSLDRWESGEELERVRKLISVAVTQ